MHEVGRKGERGDTTRMERNEIRNDGRERGREEKVDFKKIKKFVIVIHAIVFSMMWHLCTIFVLFIFMRYC